MLGTSRAQATYATNATAEIGWTIKAIVPSAVTRESDWVRVQLGTTLEENGGYWQCDFIARNPFTVEIVDSEGKLVTTTDLGTLLFKPEYSFLTQPAVVDRATRIQVIGKGQVREKSYHISEFFALRPGRFFLRATAKVRVAGGEAVPIKVEVPFMITEWEPTQ